ncbi:Hydrolase, HAD superfamily [Methanosarcina siciliae T4/M]|uniref:Hydrolase, HAD superfamily n=3 Tax=Methanosarcina siciliae TaxID=38027 RepID=A0A0E3LAM4_9EURY|nr:Hydrolase, HAD superfamily [Methanosarcina siciliae T4/M]AKB32276.1 Hydrolase, HAD superfamily [Methanosarcina siciliae HI350]
MKCPEKRIWKKEFRETMENARKNVQQDRQKTLKAVLFDMDNTLFDFVAVKLIACREILSYLGERDRNLKKEPAELFAYFLRGTYGFEDYENIKDYMQERKLFTEQAYLQCCEIYDREKLEKLELYPGVKETLEGLKKLGLRLAIITDADRYHALTRLTKVGLLDSFELLVSADMTGTKKPNPAHFLFALEALGIKPEESLVVGDSLKKDMAPARRLGLKTAYASYGDWRPLEVIEPCFDFQLNTFPDLVKCISSLTGVHVETD